VLQPWYNLVEREKFEGALQDLCVARNIAAVPYYGVASGFLTGKYRSTADLAGKPRGRAVEKYFNEFGSGVLRALDTVAAQLPATPAQIALAWLAARPAVAAPIASATTVAQLEELLVAMRLTLNTEQIALLDTASRKPNP
jgi:aryl-alcohol dehydrogenase-like predicted oxidoreductase